MIIPRAPFVNVFSHIAMPPLGALYVATSIRDQGKWDVEVIDELNWNSGISKKELASDNLADQKALQKRRPADVIGLYGGLTSTVPRLFEIAKYYQGLGIPTIAGGAHVDTLPEEAISEGIDIVVHGEGEYTILKILDTLSDPRNFADIPGISYKTGSGEIVKTSKPEPILDLDNLPIPDFKLMVETARNLRFAPIERTRGCDYNCEFCIVNHRFGPTRSASPERLAEIVERRIEEGYRHFFCVDDNFAKGKETTLKLLNLIIDVQKRHDVRIHMTIQTRSSVGRDEDLMVAMRAAGIHVLCIGLESPIKEELEGMNKKQSPAVIERDVKNLRRHGFKIHGMFIFGYPLEDKSLAQRLAIKERADRYIQFIARTGLDTIQVLKPVPIPGSRLAARLNADNRIFPLDKVGWDKYDGNFLTFLPDCGISAMELQNEATRIMRTFYSPLTFLKFPMLVLTTPVEIVARGFKRAIDYASDSTECTKARLMYGLSKTSNLRTGFVDAATVIQRSWRNAVIRSLGSVAVTSWLKCDQQIEYAKVLKNFKGISSLDRSQST